MQVTECVNLDEPVAAVSYNRIITDPRGSIVRIIFPIRDFGLALNNFMSAVERSTGRANKFTDSTKFHRNWPSKSKQKAHNWDSITQ